MTIWSSIALFHPNCPLLQVSISFRRIQGPRAEKKNGWDERGGWGWGELTFIRVLPTDGWGYCRNTLCSADEQHHSPWISFGLAGLVRVLLLSSTSQPRTRTLNFSSWRAPDQYPSVFGFGPLRRSNGGIPPSLPPLLLPHLYIRCHLVLSNFSEILSTLGQFKMCVHVPCTQVYCCDVWELHNCSSRNYSAAFSTYSRHTDCFHVRICQKHYWKSICLAEVEEVIRSFKWK